MKTARGVLKALLREKRIESTVSNAAIMAPPPYFSSSSSLEELTTRKPEPGAENHQRKPWIPDVGHLVCSQRALDRHGLEAMPEGERHGIRKEKERMRIYCVLTYS